MIFGAILLAVLQLSGGCSETRGTVGIIGVRLNTCNNEITFVHPGSPVEGILKVGDKLIAVDGSRHLETRGEPNTEIYLTVKRDGRMFSIISTRIAVHELNDRALNKYFGVNNIDD